MKQSPRLLPLPKLPRRQLLHGRVIRRGVRCHMHRHHANRRHHDFLRAVQRRSLQREPRKAEVRVGERALVDQTVERQRLQQVGQVGNARARRELQQQRRCDHLQPNTLRIAPFSPIFYFEKRVAVLRSQRDRVGKTQLRFVRAEAVERGVHKQTAALAPDLARLGEKPNGAEERGERGFGTEKEVTKEDPRRPEPTDRAEFGDRASAESEGGLPIAETSLEGERAGGKEGYELESAFESEFPRGRGRGNGVIEKRGCAGRVA